MAFTEIKTQAEFDAAIKERLDREKAKFADYEELKKKAGEAETLRGKLEEATKQVETLKSEAAKDAQKIADHDRQVSELTTRATKAERSLLCRRIAEEAKLPSALAERLTGETEEDLRADAKTLSQYLHTTTAPLATAEKTFSGAESAHEAALNSAYGELLNSLTGG